MKGNEMSVNSYLSTLASNLVLSSTEKTSITTSINTLKQRLDCYFSNGEIKDKMLFGSYTRGTILPRKYDNDSDIDFMVVFNNPYGYTPQTFLNKLKSFAEHYYSRSEIHQSSPTIVLELNHIKFDLVPAYKEYSWDTVYQIPNGQNLWKATEPKTDDDNLTACNKEHEFIIKPIIRLVKLWNIKKNHKSNPSFEIEHNIINNYYFYCSTYATFLQAALKNIRTYSNVTKVDEAIAGIEQALMYENSGMPCTALTEIKKIFPGD